MECEFAVVGLGYVGLPVALALAKKFEPVIGFDISSRRIAELRDGKDVTGEVGKADLRGTSLRFTDAPFESLTELDGLILAVPHRAYGDAGWGKLFAALAPDGILVDVKSAVSRHAVPPGIRYWSV